MFFDVNISARFFYWPSKKQGSERPNLCANFQDNCSHRVERLHMYDLANVGERVKELRMKTKKTQEEVSTVLGIKLKTYQAIEGGRRIGRVDTLCMIAEYFDTTVDYLLGNDKELDRVIEINYRNLSNDMKILAKKQIAALIKAMQ